MDDNLLGECLRRTGFENNGVVRDEYGYPSTNGERGGVHPRTVLIYYASVRPDRKEGGVPTRIPGESHVVDDEHGWHASVGNVARRTRCDRTNPQEARGIRVACRG